MQYVGWIFFLGGVEVVYVDIDVFGTSCVCPII